MKVKLRANGKKYTVIIGLLSSMFISEVSNAETSSKFQWSITPYMWATNTTVDLNYKGSPIGGADISFSNLMDVTDTAFQGHVEGGKGRWSGFVDFTTLKTSDSFSNLGDIGFVGVDTKSQQTFVDVAVAYWPGGVDSKLNFYAGVRYSEFDDQYSFYLSEVPVAEFRSISSYSDSLFGVRYRFDLSKRWALLTRADVSSGASDGIWQVQGLFAYTVGKRERNRIVFGYQIKEAEFGGGEISTDYSYDGFVAGFNFRF